MLREIYVRPLGLYPARVGDDAEEVWGGFRLARGWLDFSAVEVIERNGARVDRRIAGIGEFLERDWGRRALNAADMFEMIRQPRPRISGLDLGSPRIMGIVNVTPDSFSDGGTLRDTQSAVDHARRLEDAGADILDIGGESTRPGSDPVSLDQERARVLPVLEALSGTVDAGLSIDTRKAALMRDVARILRPGGRFIASDWLISHDGPPSPEMQTYIAKEGLDFGMASPALYMAAMQAAGLVDTSATSRNKWYRGVAREELARLTGPDGAAMAHAVGQDFVDYNAALWSLMIPVLDSGEHCPTHLRGRKPA